MAKHHQHHRYHHAGCLDEATSPNPHRLYRSQDGIIGGVCSGVARYFGWKPGFVRLGALLFLFMMPPLAFFLYMLSWFFIKRQPKGRLYDTPEDERFWRNVSTRPRVTMSELRHKFRGLEQRIVAMEQVATSEEYRLKRAFQDLERDA